MMREYLRLKHNSALTGWLNPTNCDPTPVRVEEGRRVRAELLEDRWSPFPPGTQLVGHVIFGANNQVNLSERRRAYIRFTEAELRDGRRVPICMMGQDAFGADGAILYGLDFISPEIEIAVVTRFDEGLGRHERLGRGFESGE